MTHCKTGSKHTIAMLLNHMDCLTCIYSCIKFYFPKVKGILRSFMSLRKSYFTLQRHDIIWSMSLTHQNQQHFNDSKDIFEWIVGWSIWRLSRSCSFLRLCSCKKVLPNHGCFWKLSLLLYTTSMAKVLANKMNKLTEQLGKMLLVYWKQYWVVSSEFSI